MNEILAEKMVLGAVKGTYKVCNIQLLRLPCLLFLIGFCGTSIGGSLTQNCKYYDL